MFIRRQQHRQALVREALALETKHLIGTNIIKLDAFETVFSLDDVFYLHQEPGVYAGEFVNLIHAHASSEGITDIPDTLCRRVNQFRQKFIPQIFVIHINHVFKAG